MASSVKYHLDELSIALDPDDPRHCFPVMSGTPERVLDIGCGIGQFYLAGRFNGNVFYVGLDIDIEPMIFGKRHWDRMNYVKAGGASLPFRPLFFDFVVSRGTLHLTNLPTAVTEIARVMEKGARVWMSMHSFSMQWKKLINYALKLHYKGFLFMSYVLLNGLCFHCFGKVFPFFLPGKYESFQTAKSMTKLLKSCGFSDIKITTGRHFVVTAVKS